MIESGATLGRRLEQEEDATASCDAELLALVDNKDDELSAAKETIAQQAAIIAELKAQCKA